MPDFNAQLNGPAVICTNPRLNGYNAASGARHALRLLYLKHFHKEAFDEAWSRRDFAGLDLMANMLDW